MYGQEEEEQYPKPSKINLRLRPVMDLVGEFRKVEIDDKLYLVYHNVKYPLPSINSPNDISLQPLFLCPSSRIEKTSPYGDRKVIVNNGIERLEFFSKFKISPFDDGTTKDDHILSLSRCDSKEATCEACKVQNVGTEFYSCVKCKKRYHKECVESPIEIKYPSHVKHSLQLHFNRYRSSDLCILCTKQASGDLVYYCDLCDIYMHVLCAQATIPFVIENPKRHHHILNLFPRQASLTCNVCGLVDKLHLTYICSMCDFVAHRDCIYIPQTIRISRHHHRISFISSLPLGKWSCGVCRKNVDNEYGAYTCNVCCSYAVHTKCALRIDIWDGKELEGVPEEEEDVEPFKRIADGIILHFSHDHHLRFETGGLYDDNKFCQACVLPIYEGSFYSCVECHFILHETCSNAPRKKRHPLHPYPLTLKMVPAKACYDCSVCTRTCNGFIYTNPQWKGGYTLDVRCALASEPFDYQGHQHPLFLSLDPKEKPMCHVCKSTDDEEERIQGTRFEASSSQLLPYVVPTRMTIFEKFCDKVLNCIECDFVICFKCATLPYMARYKHDQHYLTFCHGDEASDSDWCELCEGKLAIGGRKGFYKCNDCCTTLHINCLLGQEPYMKFGQSLFSYGNGDMHIVRNNSLSRPTCISCYQRCPYPIYFQDERYVLCSYRCINEYFG